MLATWDVSQTKECILCPYTDRAATGGTVKEVTIKHSGKGLRYKMTLTVNFLCFISSELFLVRLSETE